MKKFFRILGILIGIAMLATLAYMLVLKIKNDTIEVRNKEIDRQYALILQRLIDEANSRFIWYNDQWWLFTNNDDLLCPVEALIDYYCEIMKGRYAE